MSYCPVGPRADGPGRDWNWDRAERLGRAFGQDRAGGPGRERERERSPIGRRRGGWPEPDQEGGTVTTARPRLRSMVSGLCTPLGQEVAFCAKGFLDGKDGSIECAQLLVLLFCERNAGLMILRRG